MRRLALASGVSPLPCLSALMMPSALLSPDPLAAMKRLLPQWQVGGVTLRRELVFKDFVEAFGFSTVLALILEAMGHHPHWSDAWNRVVIELTIRDVGGLTDPDLRLAPQIDRLSV